MTQTIASSSLKHIKSVGELLSLAVNDYEKCIDDPSIDIDVTEWVMWMGDSCTVCIAGSIIRQTLYSKVMRKDHPNKYDEKTSELLNLIDDIRCSTSEEIVHEICITSVSIFENVIDAPTRVKLQTMIGSRLDTSELLVGKLSEWKTLRDICIELNI